MQLFLEAQRQHPGFLNASQIGVVARLLGSFADVFDTEVREEPMRVPPVQVLLKKGAEVRRHLLARTRGSTFQNPRL